MIEVSLRLVTDPDKREGVLQALLPMLGPTRVSSGCLCCLLTQDIENPDTLILLEEWASEQDLANHVRSRNYQRLLQVMEMSTEQPEIRLNEVCSTQGIEAFEKMRA